MTERLPRPEPRVIDPSDIGVLKSHLSVEDGEVVYPGGNAAAICLGILTDPLWPRAIGAVWTRDGVLLGPEARSVSEHLLSLSNAPQRWAPDLAHFLQSVVRPFDDAVGSGLDPEVQTGMRSLRQGDGTRLVWDLVSGRAVGRAKLLVRDDFYAAMLPNPGDISLETRFIGVEMPFAHDPFEALNELASTLAWLGNHRVPVLGLGPRADHSTVSAEYTVESWFRAHQHLEGIDDPIGELASLFFDMLGILDHPRADLVKRRLHQLYEEHARRTGDEA